MSKNIGTSISATIRPNDSLDPISSFWANEGKGGHHNVETFSLMNSIIEARREWGMLCSIYNDGSSNGTYQLKYNYSSTNIMDNLNWVLFDTNSTSNNLNSTWLNSVLSIESIVPATASNGDRYLIGTTASGDWVTNENKIAQWNSALNIWDFYTPINGDSIIVKDITNCMFRYEGLYNNGYWQRQLYGGITKEYIKDETIEVPEGYQYFIYGDLTIEDGNLINYGEVVTLNGELVLIGTGTFSNYGSYESPIVNFGTSNLQTVTEAGTYSNKDISIAGLTIGTTSNGFIKTTRSTNELNLIFTNYLNNDTINFSTNNGYITANRIFAKNDYSIISVNDSSVSTIGSSLITGAKTYQLPNQSGTFIVSVNGVTASSNGDISIGGGFIPYNGASDTLNMGTQSITFNNNLSITPDDDDITFDSGECDMRFIANATGPSYSNKIQMVSNLVELSSESPISLITGTGSNYNISLSTAYSLTSSNTLYFPNNSGILPISVNGVTASSNGNIVLTTATPNLQGVMSSGSIGTVSTNISIARAGTFSTAKLTMDDSQVALRNGVNYLIIATTLAAFGTPVSGLSSLSANTFVTYQQMTDQYDPELANKADKVGSDNIEITSAANGLILRSPNGNRWLISVNNSGVISATAAP